MAKFRDISRKLRAPFNRRHALAVLRRFHSRQRSTEELVELAMDFNTRGLYRVDSVQIREEILALANAVKSIRPRTILEIGTCNGGSLFIWANLATELVVTCDLNKSKIRDELYRRFPPPSSDCRVVSLMGDSHSPSFFEKVKNTLDGRLVDFLFIDGDHSEAGVESDFNMYRELVRPGGIIAFHDIVQKQPTPNNQVYYFWERIKGLYRVEEFVRNKEQVGFGIGIIHVK